MRWDWTDEARSHVGPWFIGVDIETDTTVDGLDPRVAGVISWAIAGEATAVTYLVDDRSEVGGLIGLFAALHGLASAATVDSPLVVATWNGAGFDWPFLHTRLEQVSDLSPTLWPFRLHLSDERPPKYQPIGDHPGGYLVDFPHWQNVYHLDVAYAFKDLCATTGTSWNLKAVMDHHGIPRPVAEEGLGAHAGELPRWLLSGYNLADAEGTRLLAEVAVERLGLSCIDPRVP